MEIIKVGTPAQLDEAACLFGNADALVLDLCFQNFEREGRRMAAHGEYAPRHAGPPAACTDGRTSGGLQRH